MHLFNPALVPRLRPPSHRALSDGLRPFIDARDVTCDVSCVTGTHEQHNLQGVLNAAHGGWVYLVRPELLGVAHPQPAEGPGRQLP
eukprot:514386-Pyramimonas_sp.AAC.1